MTYYLITDANSINFTTSSTITSARDLGAGDSLFVMDDAYVMATGDLTNAVYVNAFATNAQVTVDGSIIGTRDGIFSLGMQTHVTVNGHVAGGDTGISVANSSTVFVSDTGVVSGFDGISLSGNSSLINNGEVVASGGGTAIDLNEGSIINNGVISSSWQGIFFGGEHSAWITNNGSVFGGLTTWAGAADDSISLTIKNSGDWHGDIGLTLGGDTLTNTGVIDGDVSLGGGSDILDSRYGKINGNVYGGAGNDMIRTGSGDDWIDGGAGADTIDGGAGSNTISYQSSAHAVSVNLLAGTAKYGDASGDQLTRIQNVTGTLADDVLVGDNSANVINGLIGKDVLNGNGGNDSFVMYGGGDAAINGGSGNDHIQLATVSAQLYGSAFSANNKIDGGSGFDTLDLVNSGPVVMKSSTLIHVEKIVVEDGYNYSLTTANATVASGASLEIEAGSLTSSHKIVFNGSAETNGHFLFNGGDGKDSFKGGAGKDVIAGNSGADTLKGGGGADTFVFHSPSDSLFSKHDTITDFNADLDKFRFDVDVTGMNAKITGSVSTSTDLKSLLAGHFDADHAVLVKVDGGSLNGHTLLVVDGDSKDGFYSTKDYVVDVTNIHGTLTASDFLF